MTEATKAFDPINIVQARNWSEKQRAELLAALARHVDPTVYNLGGVHFQGDAALACDGHRLLCVRGFEDLGLTGKTLAVYGGRLAPWSVDGEFPDWRQAAFNPADAPHEFTLSRVEIFRKVRTNNTFAVSITDRGVVFGGAPDALFSLQMRYLAALPNTDADLVISFRDKLSSVIVHPKAGGWFGVLMPIPTDAADSPLKRVRGAA